MKAPTIPEGFLFVRRGQNIDITCTHKGCHHSTTVAAEDDLWARRFIDKHKKLHGEAPCQ